MWVKVRIGRLKLWLQMNPLRWQYGLCTVPDDINSTGKTAFIILCGPLASTFIALVGCYLAFSASGAGLQRSIFVIFIFSALLDLLYNLYPRKTPSFVRSGKRVFNDGRQLVNLWRFSRSKAKYKEAYSLFDAHDFKGAGALFDGMLALGNIDDMTYRYAIAAHTNAGHHHRAIALYKDYKQLYGMSAEDHNALGRLLANIHQLEDALVAFNTAATLDPAIIEYTSNKAFALLLLERYEEAISNFDNVLHQAPTFDYAFANKGLAQVLLGHEEQGLANIQQALKLNPNCAYAYRSLGIYFTRLGNTKKAIQNLAYARQLDPNVYDIVQLIEDATFTASCA